jgi:hypothetical protein
VLCVGTIESRKNHLALFQAWKLLLEEGFEPPPLIWVGRPGWRVEDLLAQLAATRSLDGRIRLLHGVSDPELVALYRGALFSVFPSFTEGWGLPVGESLALGTPCLASPRAPRPRRGRLRRADRPLRPAGHRRTGAPLCRGSRGAGGAAQAHRRGLPAPGLGGDDGRFVAQIEACLALPAAQPRLAAPALAAGTRLGFPALGALLGPGFAPPAAGLAWMNARTATLRLLSEGPGRALLHLASGGAGRLAISVGEAAPRLLTLPREGDARVLLDMPGGDIRVTLHLPGEGRCGLRGLDLLPAGTAAVPPRRAVRFGAGGDALAWAPLAESGFDLGGGAGLPVLGEAGVLRLRVAPGPLRLLLLLEGEGVVEHPGGATPAAPALLLALDAPDGELRLALHPHGPLRLHALQWAAEDDLEGRLALLEQAAPRGASLAERLAALETARPAPGLPGGAAGWLARRLGTG